MDWMFLFIIILFAVLVLSFVAYSVTTNKIIKDQEKEIAALETRLKRLQIRRNNKGIN